MSLSQFTEGPWEIDPHTGHITAIKPKCRIGFFQGLLAGSGQRKEHFLNCRLIAMAPEIYGALIELHASHTGATNPTDRQFEAMRQTDLLIQRMNEPVAILPRTPPAQRKP